MNNQKRVVYIGWWLRDADIPTIVTTLKGAGVTHILLAFIVQPDSLKPLTGTPHILDSFNALNATNKLLLTSNFRVGTSLGGALHMPVPFSNTFFPTDSYYHNNPVKYARDYFDLVKGTGMTYFDLDIEDIKDKFEQCADFIGNVCKELKNINPNFSISHAPELCYFWSSYGHVYDLIYQKYKQYFDFMNIQFYNSGLSQTFEHIFIKSINIPKTSVLELMNIHGIDPSYIIVGKQVTSPEKISNGYVPLATMTAYVQQAFNTPSLSLWCKSGGGLMVWFWKLQSLTCQSNIDINQYFLTTSKLSPQ